jgi:hypothetical protein
MAKATRTIGIPAASRVENITIKEPLLLRVGDRVVTQDYSWPVVERIVEEPAIPGKVTLELSEEEAEVIAAVLRTVGGAPDTRRGLVEKVLLALIHDAAVKYDGRRPDDLDGSLYFK